ncbi:hypothetical protein N0V94_006785 [Neodidymelliopsis sp. IMI 364377]|nr:hypothetical protein N0V94_006785 [Neodidymelliopsis sp. IMI 364377]
MYDNNSGTCFLLENYPKVGDNGIDDDKVGYHKRSITQPGYSSSGKWVSLLLQSRQPSQLARLVDPLQVTRNVQLARERTPFDTNSNVDDDNEFVALDTKPIPINSEDDEELIVHKRSRKQVRRTASDVTTAITQSADPIESIDPKICDEDYNQDWVEECGLGPLFKRFVTILGQDRDVDKSFRCACTIQNHLENRNTVKRERDMVRVHQMMRGVYLDGIGNHVPEMDLPGKTARRYIPTDQALLVEYLY